MSRTVAVEEMRSGQKLSTYEREIESARFADRSNVGYERKKGIKGDYKSLGPRNWKDGSAIY